MATDLFTPILNDRTRAPNFFNGRLLSGEAMTDEQRAQRIARELLAQSVGDGIAHGLEVEIASSLSTVDNPVVLVKEGVAINRRGEILLLTADTPVQLVRPAHAAAAPSKVFRTCTPPNLGAYVADDGVYLLSICSVGAGEGLAPVSGLGDTPRGCNIKYVASAVELRLMELPSSGIARDSLLRNEIAHRCFGAADPSVDSYRTRNEPVTLLDGIRGTQLTDCDVPLALMYWTASGGIQYVDLWSVRRRITRTQSNVAYPLLSDAAKTAAEARVLQFDEHLGFLIGSRDPRNIRATSYFHHLPPVGMVPLWTDSLRRGIVVDTFFADLKVRPPEFMEGPRISDLFRRASRYAPIETGSAEVFWLYQVRSNTQRSAASSALQPMLIFCSGHVPYVADAQYDLSYFNYANYA